MRTNSCLLAATLAASFLLLGQSFGQSTTIQAEVKGADGRAAKGAEVRIERQDKKADPVIARTDAKGRFSAQRLDAGTYRVTATLPSGARSSQLIKTEGSKPIVLTFDMKPLAGNGVAANKKKVYRWVPPAAGSHMGGHYEEVGSPSTYTGPGASNVEQISTAAIQRPGLAARPPGSP